MGEWKRLDVLICEYIEGQHRLDKAIERNRERIAIEGNRRRRLCLNREYQILLTMRADLAYAIAQMQKFLGDEI